MNEIEKIEDYGKFKKIFVENGEKGYYKCRDEIYGFIENKINDLTTARRKSNDFDSAILSVMIEYLRTLKNEILDFEFEE